MKIFQNKLIFKNFFSYFFVIIFSFFIHFVSLNFQPVNDEFIFFKGADFIITFEKKIINIFFEYNANTLGFSYLISGIKLILPFLETSQISKILSFSSLIFFGVATKNLYLIFKPKIKFNFFLIIVLLNPLVWSYAFRGIPDPFSASLSLFTITQIILSKNNKLNFLYISLFSLAVIIKPFNSILLLLIFYFDFLKKKKLTQSVYLILVFLLINYIYFNLNYYNFGFFITPPQFSKVFIPSFENYLVTFLSYIGFIIFFSYPFFIKFINIIFQKKLKFNFIFYFSAIFLSYLISLKINFNLSEMNFGFISNFINIKLFEILILFNNILFLIYFFNNLKNKKILIILSILLIFISIMSFTHSAQRYLMVLVPLIYIFFFRIHLNKNYYFIVLVTYIIINIIIFANLFNNHKTISNTVNYLKQNNLINNTHPGYIGQHALNNFTKFYQNNKKKEKEEIFGNKKYIVKDYIQSDEVFLFKTTSKFLFIKKTLFVIKN